MRFDMTTDWVDALGQPDALGTGDEVGGRNLAVEVILDRLRQVLLAAWPVAGEGSAEGPIHLCIRIGSAGSADDFPAQDLTPCPPLGPQVIYDVETADGSAVKITQARDGAATPYASGSTVHFAPVSTAACHVFAADQRRGP